MSTRGEMKQSFPTEAIDHILFGSLNSSADKFDNLSGS